MNSWPKISIVTPSFNQGQYLEQTIQSVLDQGYPNLEYIIIDGGSSDNSVSIIHKYQQHLKYWVSEPDSGQSHAINKGLKVCTGSVFNWLNSDDYYAPNALKRVGEIFKDDKINVVAGRSNLFGVGLVSRTSRGTCIYEHNLAKTIGWARIDQPETFFRLSCIKKIGHLNEDLNYLMDRDLWIRYLLEFGIEAIAKIDDKLVNFRLHQNSKTVSQSNLFDKERNNYFYSLALNCGLQTSADLIHSVEQSIPLHNVPFIENKILAADVINYFLLLLSEEHYQLEQQNKVKLLLNNISTKHLAFDDIKLFQKIKFRNQYLPLWLIRMLRNK